MGFQLGGNVHIVIVCGAEKAEVHVLRIHCKVGGGSKAKVSQKSADMPKMSEGRGTQGHTREGGERGAATHAHATGESRRWSLWKSRKRKQQCDRQNDGRRVIVCTSEFRKHVRPPHSPTKPRTDRHTLLVYDVQGCVGQVLVPEIGRVTAQLDV